MDSESQKIIPQVIDDEMKDAYLAYSMSVIVGRALPDVRDGLKPVHRRILYAMHQMGMTHKSSFRKCARIVGEVLGKYHPHGDSAVYDSLVRMAQEFSLRYTLVDGHGNFGSIDGDNAAAMRYTEARLQKISGEMVQDIEKETVDYTENFDGSLKEPSVLPNKIPNILINGSTGIAVGMATNIPPHNLTETLNAVIELIDNPEAQAIDLIQHVKGPDFPTGGTILGQSGILQAYKTGKGRVLVRSKIHEEEANSRIKLVVTEIPYMVNKSVLIEQIADLVKDKKIEGISDLRDESDRDGMRIVIELKKDADVEVLKNQLYKNTRLQDAFNISLLALDKNTPKLHTLKDILERYIEHRKEVITKRTEYNLNKAKARAHILEGLLIALKNIDDVIATIKASESSNHAKSQLITKYDLSEEQSSAVLDMKLQKLAKLESEKIEEEHKHLQDLIKEYNKILSNENEILTIIKDESKKVIENFGDERRTNIVEAEYEDIEDEDLIEKEDCVITLTKSGYVKRTSLDTYKVQRRGGVGIIGTGHKEGDFTTDVFIANTHSYLLIFTNKGIVHWVKAYKVPESQRYSKGKAIINLININKDEHITSIIPVSEFDPNQYLVTATKNGIVKKTSLDAYSRPRNGGIIALTLDDNDYVRSVKLTNGKNILLLATQKGLTAKFKEEDARPIGRTSRGVKGINLTPGDEVTDMIITDDENSQILTLTKNGYGKRTSVSEYRLINRGGKGVRNINVTSKTGEVAKVSAVAGNEEIMLITKKGMIVRTEVENISLIGRNTQGVRVIKLREDDELNSFAKIITDEDVEENEN